MANPFESAGYAIYERVFDAGEILHATAAGGGVAMRPLTLHASSKSVSTERRRVRHIEYAASLTFGAGIELAVG